MLFREAVQEDIPQMQIVRRSVRENALSNPNLIKDEDYIEFIETRGKGWVCEINNKIAGFAVADLKEENVWALFVSPDAEGRGIGKRLHNLMLDWYFSCGAVYIWLGTAPNTRAEKFYELNGWQRAGVLNNGEVKFEMNSSNWLKLTPEKSK